MLCLLFPPNVSSGLPFPPQALSPTERLDANSGEDPFPRTPMNRDVGLRQRAPPGGIMVMVEWAQTPRVRPAAERSTRMPRYVVLAKWTDQGIRNVEHTTERIDHGGELAEKHGLELEQAYWTVGPYDMLTIFEAPDD